MTESPSKVSPEGSLFPVDHRPILITGGAGFIGCNAAHRLLSQGHTVVIYDNLSRAGVERNLDWLQSTHGAKVIFERADVCDRARLTDAVRRCSRIFHFAAQVAVTTSLVDPIRDFEVNTIGTLNLLEAVRSQAVPPPLVFTSTNKVYGDLEDLTLTISSNRYEPGDDQIRALGISEERNLSFHSPYGCSKGAADQYVVDYARTYNLPAVVFRMSCIYGPRQFGTEDQGWVAHFLIQALSGLPITLFGDGKQVRDLLFVDDLVNALMMAQAKIETVTGQAFNIGGGPSNTVSLLELMDLMTDLLEEKPDVRFADWRPGDQRYYVSDTRRYQEQSGWTRKTNVREGVERLTQWLLLAREADTPPAPSTHEHKQVVRSRVRRRPEPLTALHGEPT